MPVIWKGRAAIFRREVGDGEHAEVVIEGRIYRVRLNELRRSPIGRHPQRVHEPLNHVAEVLVASYVDQLGRDLFKRLGLNIRAQHLRDLV
jgi:hypothetical protein